MSPSSVQLEFGFTQNIEGIVDYSSQGIETRTCMLSEEHESALGLQRKYNPNELFLHRSALLESYLQRHFGFTSEVAGFWYAPLVSLAEDLISWGADRLSEGSALENVLSAVGEIAAAALGTAVPELLPFIAAIKPAISMQMRNATSNSLKQVKQWADTKPISAAAYNYDK